MKKLIIPLLAIFLFASCTNDAITDQQEELISTSLKGKKANIVVEPSGDLSGTTDADAIESALAELPTGGILLLDKGTFYINRTIVAPDGFNGTINGKGMNKTEVIAVGDGEIPFDVFDGSYSTLYFPNPQGLVSVSNMTITLTEDFIAEGWPFPGLEFDLIFSYISSFINVDLGAEKTDTNFNKLRLTGTTAPSSMPFSGGILPFTPRIGIVISTEEFFIPTRPFSLGGEHILTNSELSKLGIYPVYYQKMNESSIEMSNNQFFDMAQVHLQWLDGCNVLISNNEVEANSIGTIVVTQQGAPIEGTPNNVHIIGNKVSTNGFAPIEIGPTTGDASFNLRINDNELAITGPPDPFVGFSNFAGILIGTGNDNAVVKDNRILGTADYGISQESDNGMLKDNDLSDFGANLFDYILVGNNNELKGIGNSTVDDQGTGNTIKN